MNKILPIILVVVLSGFSGGSYSHVLLGGGHQTWDERNTNVLLHAEVNGLKMRHVRVKTIDGYCKNGYLDIIELHGFIGSDSTVMVKRMIDRLEPCFNNDGEKVPNIVYLNSNGGYLFDGYAMGRLFRENEIKTVIADGVVCASSCAAAFIGGKYRAMGQGAKLVFHSPYNKTGVGIDCDNTGHTSGLKGYYSENLPKEDSELLLERTLSYCSVNNGWTLNEGAAVLYNIINDKTTYFGYVCTPHWWYGEKYCWN